MVKMDVDILEVDSLRQFTIPKRKTDKPDLLNRVDMGNNDAQDMLNIIRQSYKDRENYSNFIYSRPRIVHNTKLIEKFNERKKQMKFDGYTDKELIEVNGFLEFSIEHKAINACKEGVKTGNTNITCLGNSQMGVYLCKHADIVTPEPLRNNQNGFIVIFKMIKGRVKFMTENRNGEPLDPTPNFDCHLMKASNIDATSHKYLYEASQFYLYEYSDDSDLAPYPSQILPMAIMNYRFQGIYRKDRSVSIKPPLKIKRMPEKSTLQSTPVDDQPAKKAKLQLEQKVKSDPEPILSGHSLQKDPIVWTGQLEMCNTLICKVNLLSSHDLLSCTSLIGGHLTMMDRFSLKSINEFYFSSSVKQTNINNNGTPILKLDPTQAIVHNEYSYCCGTLIPEFPKEQKFKSLVLELSRSASAGLIKLIDGTHILVLPDSSLTNQIGLQPRTTGYFLHCIFISKESIQLKITDMVRKNYLEDETCVRGVADHPDSPDQRTIGEETRDPRRRKVTFDMALQSSPVQASSEKTPEKRIVIVSSSRLLISFDKMASVQDRRNIEIARMNRQHPIVQNTSNKPLLPLPNIKPLIPDLHPENNKQDKLNAKSNLDEVKNIELKKPSVLETKPSLPSHATVSKSLTDPRRVNRDPRLNNKNIPIIPIVSEVSVSVSETKIEAIETPLNSQNNPLHKSNEIEKIVEAPIVTTVSSVTGDLKLPDAVYTVVFDPRVQKLLDDLQKQNIIGTGDSSPVRPHEEKLENNNAETDMDTDAPYSPSDAFHLNSQNSKPNNYNNYPPNYQQNPQPMRTSNYRNDSMRGVYARESFDNSNNCLGSSYSQQPLIYPYDGHNIQSQQQQFNNQLNNYTVYNQAPFINAVPEPILQRPEDPRLKRNAAPQIPTEPISQPLLQTPSNWSTNSEYPMHDFPYNKSPSSSNRPTQNIALLPNPSDVDSL